MIRAWGVAFALVLSSAVAAQPPRSLTRRDRPEVQSVSIVGAKHVDAGALADGLVTHPSHCKSFILTPFCLVWKTPLFYEHDYLDRTELKRDVLRALIFLYRHGYHDAIVDTVVTPPSGGAGSARTAGGAGAAEIDVPPTRQPRGHHVAKRYKVVRPRPDQV